MELLGYRAGAKALAVLHDRGLRAADLQALILPAIGPKWLVLAGLDRALLEHGWLDAQPNRLLLFGASIGAWRALAMAACDPQRAHAALLQAYCQQRFTHADDARAISAAYRRLIAEVFSDDDVAHAVRHPKLDLALATARARGALGFDQRFAQALLIGSAATLNLLSAKTQALFFERVIFDTCSQTGPLPNILHTRVGLRAPLTTDNLREVALASGSVPMYMQLIRDIAHAPKGAYLDGGFSDYHLNQRVDGGDGISVLFLHQRRIVPSWLDKFVPWRRYEPDAFSRLLVVYPSSEFVRSLPGGYVPTRDDFKHFVDRPEERIARWQQVAAQSGELATSFLYDVAHGTIASRARTL